MSVKKPIVAIMYDFDKTLCNKNMQEYTFISDVGMEIKDFWKESKDLAKKYEMDNILAYMYLMVKKSSNYNLPTKRNDFVKLGEHVEFFEGVTTWFKRINKIGNENGVTIEHYIISSGLKEIIQGSSIAKEFKQIYACEFFYDQNEIAVWPKTAVNYTAKTQFLFRINKGVLDVSEDEKLNRFTPDEERRIPFRNMIYIGDGITDVPCMKLVKANGGQSIAVCAAGQPKTGRELMNDGRVNFVTKADYKEGKEIEKIVSTIIRKISAIEDLVKIHKTHKKNAITAKRSK